MTDYYSTKLSGRRLKALYESALPRIQQYLQAEIDHLRTLIPSGAEALEMGCGYGRVIRQIADQCDSVVGIDTAWESLEFGRGYLANQVNSHLLRMDAVNTAFADDAFDIVLCVQNGISAFHVDHLLLIDEAVRVTRPGGLAVFSTYAGEFWDERLRWFEQQAGDGFIGPIDYERTGNGDIVCRDGFTAITVTESEFRRLTERAGLDVDTYEVDRSSLFCTIRKLKGVSG